ncbi:tyrosine-protein phosphatase [Candidatus Babeliales bacterium]|nr:tyrosine-protein phosphatase [Candidatus Babeliales bacterium]
MQKNWFLVFIGMLLCTSNCHGLAFFRQRLDNFFAVEKGALYRSRQLSPRRLQHYLKKHNIKTVINLRGTNTHKHWWRQELAAVDALDVKFFNISMNASGMSSKNNLVKLLSLYQNAPKPILIHCKSGTDRTGEAAALWVLEQQKRSKKAALKQFSFLKHGYITRRRPAKKLLIKIWQNYQWLVERYNPCHYAQLFS